MLTEAADAQQIGLAGLLNPEASGLVVPRHAGKPDPRWQRFHWKFTDLDPSGAKLRLFFYAGEDWTARYAIPELGREVEELKSIFGFVPKDRFRYLLFSSHRNFQQTNVFNISEGVQGITSTQEPTMAIPYWGEAETFRHISTHEMVHQFQVQKMSELTQGRVERVQALLPLWFVEGMAEQYSLRGVDAESRYYIRDLLLHPKKDLDYEMPKFFDETAMNFIFIYKLGQAKIDFFEAQFGKGTAQRLLETASKNLGVKYSSFKELVLKELAISADDLDKKWNAYLDQYKKEVDSLPQELEAFEEVKEATENIDLFEASPDGSLGATREIDPLKGVTSVYLFNMSKPGERIKVAEDNRPANLSLHFMAMPVLALSDSEIGYVVETVQGAEIEVRSITRSADGKLELGPTRRSEIRKHGIREASSLTFSPDGSTMAFVGLSEDGRQNLFTVPVPKDDQEASRVAKPEQLTDEFYSWRDLSWGKGGLIGVSDRTASKRYNLFSMNPSTRKLEQLTSATENQLAPEAVAPAGSSTRIVFQSWESGTSQIHLLEDGQEFQLTQSKSPLFHPRLRGDQLYFIAYRSGRFRLYRTPVAKLKQISREHAVPGAVGASWHPELATLDPAKIQPYTAFSTGTRLENLAAFFGSGGIGGLGATVSDLMRDYAVSGQFTYLGSSKFANSYLMVASQEGRTNWNAGAYYSVLPRVDSRFSSLNETRFYLHREYGVTGGFQYPFGAFYYGSMNLALGSVTRTDFSDPALAPAFEATNPGSELVVNPNFRFGRDRIIYETFTGPLSGYGIMGEADLGYFPSRKSWTERYRLDLAYYWQIVSSTVLALQSVAGVATGDQFTNPFFVSSDDILRAYPFGDVRLLGDYLIAGKAELRFPIGTLFKFPPLRGVVGYDQGSVFNQWGEQGQRVTSSASFGLDLNLPPLSLGFISARPIRVAAGPQDSSVFHFTLRYLYF